MRPESKGYMRFRLEFGPVFNKDADKRRSVQIFTTTGQPILSACKHLRDSASRLKKAKVQGAIGNRG
jgi:hypothetical protein